MQRVVVATVYAVLCTIDALGADQAEVHSRRSNRLSHAWYTARAAYTVMLVGLHLHRLVSLLLASSSCTASLSDDADTAVRTSIEVSSDWRTMIMGHANTDVLNSVVAQLTWTQVRQGCCTGLPA
jgi:hypothetical protein